MKILIADDHGLMREGLRAILAGQPDMTVVGEARDGHDAIAQAVALTPDVVVMDISMPGLNGVEATRRVIAAVPTARVVGLSMNSDPRYVRAMFEAGASGYMLKNCASEELLRCLRAVADDRTYVSPSIAGVVVEGFVRGGRPALAASPSGLSAREREVLQLLAEGKSSKEMAAQLGVAVSTVETYRRNISEKLGLHSIAELTKYAMRHGLTSMN